MKNVWESNASVSPPTVVAASVGYPTDGDLPSSTSPTTPGAWWYHMITSELLAIVTAASIAPSGSVLNQVLAALNVLFAPLSGFTGANQSLAAAGYQKLPGGIILQWGSQLVGDVPGGGAPYTGSISFPIAFPTACLNVSPSISDATLTGISLGIFVGSKSASTWSYTLEEWTGRTQNCTVTWFAIGY